MSDGVRYLRLKPEFCRDFHWDVVARDKCREWARTKRTPAIHISKQRWAGMKRGMPVPNYMVIAFSEYVSDVRGLGRYTLSQIAEACPPETPAKPERRAARTTGWNFGWFGLWSNLDKHLLPSDDAPCKNEAELMEAASMVVAQVGRENDPSLTGEAAIRYGEEYMQQSREEYAAFLTRLWKNNPDSVLFTTRRKRGEVIRWGVSVVAPLAESFFARLRGGEAEDVDIGPGDLVPHSSLLLLDAVSFIPEKVQGSEAARALAQARTGLYQLASLSMSDGQAGGPPWILAFCGSPENRKRLEAFNFAPAGAHTPRTKLEIMEFARPVQEFGIRTVVAHAAYDIMQALIRMYAGLITNRDRFLES